MLPWYSNTRTLLLIFSLAVLSAATGALAWRLLMVQRTPAIETVIVLPESRLIADFELTDDQGQPFSLQDFKGHWSLLFFGFTSCPDVCPNTLHQLQQVRQLIAEDDPQAEIPRIYLISVDPERDSPEKLDDYLSYFDPAFIGLTGAHEQLTALAFQLSIAFFIEPHEAGNLEYNVDHSASVLLLNPSAQLYGVLPAPIDAPKVARDVMTIIR